MLSKYASEKQHNLILSIYSEQDDKLISANLSYKKY